MTEETKEVIAREIARATRLVASWPRWKQNILEQSGKPTMSESRMPIYYKR